MPTKLLHQTDNHPIVSPLTASRRRTTTPPPDLTPAEKLWLDLCDRAYYLLLDRKWETLRKTRRRLVVGASDTADGWTDGDTYIALDRRFLRRLTLDTRGVTALGLVLVHEYCHDDADTGTHTHSLEFYENFHNKCREKLPEFVSGCLTRLPNVLKAAKRRLSREVLKEMDRAAAGRQALEDLLESTKIAADVDAAAAGQERPMTDPGRPKMANQAYDLYDHGDMDVLSAGPWWPLGDLWLRIVLVGDDFHPKNPKPLVFAVRFAKGRNEVEEAYYDVRP